MSGEVEPIKQPDNGVIPGLSVGSHGVGSKQKKHLWEFLQKVNMTGPD